MKLADKLRKHTIPTAEYTEIHFVADGQKGWAIVNKDGTIIELNARYYMTPENSFRRIRITDTRKYPA